MAALRVAARPPLRMRPLRCLPQLALGSLALPASSGHRTATSASSPFPWPGLDAWRRAPHNAQRAWGLKGPSPEDPHVVGGNGAPTAAAAGSLAELGALVLATPDPLGKSRLSHLAFCRWLRRVNDDEDLPVGEAVAPDVPARPPKPSLVTPKEVPGHKAAGLPLNAHMLHGLAHVELNAIDLAWDTVVRFSPLRDVLGEQFFADFARVADDESRHFAWCSQRLAELGFR